MKKYIPQSTLDEVLKVLEFGDTKHPGENWKKESSSLHIAHARLHIDTFLFKTHIDDETKCSHLAHAVCRLLFAMSKEKNER